MTMHLSAQATEARNMLTVFVEQTSGVEQCIAVSADGLLVAISSNLERGGADKLAAIVTGLRSLSDGAARLLGKGGLNQVVVEMKSGYLFVTSIGGGAAFGVMASRSSDLGLVGYELVLLVDRMRVHLTPELISELKHSLVAV